MAVEKKGRTHTLGAVLRQRRRQLDITQQDVAKQVGVRANYIGYLERNMRRPSTSVLVKLGKVLDLDHQELFLLAHPQMRAVITPENPSSARSAWDEFRSDKRLHTRHNITRGELDVLKTTSRLGAARSSRDYLFILQAIRQALQ